MNTLCGILYLKDFFFNVTNIIRNQGFFSFKRKNTASEIKNADLCIKYSVSIYKYFKINFTLKTVKYQNNSPSFLNFNILLCIKCVQN